MGEGGWVSFRTPSGTNLPRKRWLSIGVSLPAKCEPQTSEGMEREIRWLLTVIKQLKKVLIG